MWNSLAAVALFVLLDGLLFHSGIYTGYLEPHSSAGELEARLAWLKQTPARQHEVMVVGDSRIAEGLSAAVATKATGGRIHFRNFGIPGASPRVWYYLIRDADPERNRFDAIVLSIGQYSDQDLSTDLQEQAQDENYLVGRLRYRDCPAFAGSFLHSATKLGAFTGCVLRGIALRADLQALLRSPAERLNRVQDWREHGLGYTEAYQGKREAIDSRLAADFEKRTISFPAGLTEPEQGSIRATVLPNPEPQTGLFTKYRARWLGAILDLYLGSKTRVIFCEAPRAPLSVPEPPTPGRFVNSVRGRPGVVVLPEDTFRDLERPELFADGLHLNKAGRPLFSARLARIVAARLR